MNRDQNLVRQELSKFFTSHPDAAAFFVVAGLELEYVRMAMLGVRVENVQPGDKKGYTEIIRRVVAQRERDQLQRATAEDPALGIGTNSSAGSPADLPPPVMSLRQLDPKTSGVPWWSGNQIFVRLVDPQRMIARHEEVTHLPPDQSGGGGGLFKMLPMIGRPRELRRIAVTQLEQVRSLRLKFPHCAAVIERVQSALHARAVAGSWAQIPPILLKGGPGTGKTTFARALANCLGVDFFQIAASHDILKLTGLGPPWRGATVGALAKALGKSPDGGDEQGCANPVLLIDELDKAGGQIRSADGAGEGGGFFDQLLCIEPQNSNLIDAFLGDTMPICVRYVSWIFTANNIEKIPDYLLSRIEIFDISQPTAADYRNGLLNSIFGSLVDELPYGSLFAPLLTSEVIDRLAESGMSPREIRRALEEAMEGAVCAYADTPARGSVRLTPGHFKTKNVKPKSRAIGFIQEIAA